MRRAGRRRYGMMPYGQHEMTRGNKPRKGKIAMTTHKGWFSVGVEKRAAKVRSHLLSHITKGGRL